jgi:non-ribosomal peptide synthetase component F
MLMAPSGVCYRTQVSSTTFDALLERVRVEDPDLVLAAEEIDRDLLDWFATLTPRQRLDRAARMGTELERLRRDRRSR